MKVVTTNKLNRFWKKGIKPVIDSIADKFDKAKLANNCLTTEEGFALDARQGTALQGEINEINSNLGFVLLPNFGNQHSGCIVCNPAAKTVSITLGLYSGTSFANKTLIYNISTQYAPKNKKFLYGVAQKDHQLFSAQLVIDTDGSITYYGGFGDGSCDMMIFTGSYCYG